MEKRISGKVLLSFVIDRDGSITDAKIVQSVHPLLDAEALRIINAMSKWKPGKKDGKPVKVQFTVPVEFRMVN